MEKTVGEDEVIIKGGLPYGSAGSSVHLSDLRSEFSASLAHELRTPLGGMLSMLDLLLTTCMPAKQKEYLEVAYSLGQTLMGLVDEVLTFSEIEAGNIQIAQQECHLLEILDEVVGLLAGKALKKSINIGYVIAPDVPNVVVTDAGKLRQILIHLLDNAVKFTHFGEVSIYVERRTSLDSAGEYTEGIGFCVKDQGIGIAPENHQRIFDAFFQVDSSSTKVYEGTGLGLAIARKMVELMDGQLELFSDLGVGSQFALTLPIKSVDRSVLENGSKPLVDQAFLLVTRSPVTRDFIVNDVQSLGSNLVVAESGQEAVQQIVDADPGAFQAILIDEDLGDMSVTDFVGLIQDCLNFRDTFSVVFANPYFSSYHLDNLQVARLNKPLKSTSLKPLLCSHFLPDQKPSRQLSKGTDVGGESAVNVLVVEDSRINQQVAEAILRRLGCSYEVAADGRLGVEKVVYGNFDLVLMDCNMPVLSGYAATKQIRNFEEEDAGKLPIVAMTVNNSESEKKLCAEAGISDFMPKPLSLVDMREMLAKWTDFSVFTQGKACDSTICEVDPASECTELSYDPQMLDQLAAVVGSSINNVIKDFCSDMDTYMNTLKSAVVEANVSEIGYIAHTIKGAAKNFGAHELAKLSSRLENRVKQGEIENVEEAVRSIDREVVTLSADLNRQTQAIYQLEPVADRFENRDRVLVVDDDRTSRVVLAEGLRNGGCDVEEARDGLEALDICGRCMPDLIMMDAIMPGLDGFDLCQKIRSMPYGADIPILIITASESEESVALAFSVAATDFINKPVNISVIQKRVNHLIAANKAERYMRQLAYHDSLTGLPNRTNLMQHLQLVMDQSKVDNSMFAVLFLDLDDFKVVNDNMGHDVGDLLLKAVSERLRSYLRGQDFIARLGGDEFTIVLQDVKSLCTVEAIAEKICKSFSQPFAFMRREILVTTSMGISVFPNHGEEIADLLKYADSAMFSAKNARDRFCFYESGMESAVSQRLEMQRDLRKALDHNELRLLYQPKVDCSDGSLLGAEALLRWQHPIRGLIGPDEFIAFAEEGDLIAEINNWVLKNGIKQLCNWAENDHKLTLSLNISLNAATLTELHSEILSLIQSHPLSADLLELEITENTLMSEPKLIGKELSKIRELGIKIALDDFGSGHSSLNHLKELPVDVLKIDRLFIRDIETDPSGCAIVKSIICLAEALNIATVAEGVETDEQKEILSDLGCDYFQGYLVSEPITCKQFEQRFLEEP